jgi:hypothetical protein
MRRTLAVVVVLMSAIAFAQTATPTVITVQRDPAAVAAVQNAIAAMGGSAVAGIQNCTAQASVQPTPDAHSSPYTITYVNSGSQFRYQSLRDGITTITASDGNIYRRQVGSGTIEKLGNHLLVTEFPKPLAAWVLYQRLQNQNYSLIYSGTAVVNGRTALLISTRLESNPDWAPLTAQVWSLDSATGLPLRVDWVIALPQNSTETVNARTEFDNFQRISGVLIPFQLTTYVSGIKIDVTTLNSAVLNSGISPTTFQLGGAQ